ncbi:class I SAM-dependent methyltransferase [Roseimaritima sediminicola]|uniref:class I SAM-dependent methyltransferase n=1 Tax=Roseimaritima sediminicola TaxID=2662066 RepID=UPI001298573B|nr:class I SAM-dependent methyltransferase [Roseimaritima sediminicola]
MDVPPSAASQDASPDDDPFYDVYDREQPAYGMTPSAELAAYLRQCHPAGRALDLGAGGGRDTLELARAGLQVVAIDRSQRGLDLVMRRAEASGLAARVTTQAMDVQDCQLEPNAYRVIVATTVLDHIPMPASRRLWQQMVAALQERGAMYVEVHTSDDPGSSYGAGAQRQGPVSETASHVINHFPPNRLLQMAIETPGLRVLRYEERAEWDYTHGPEHLHAKAVLLATKATLSPDWYGYPAAFTRRGK